MAPTDDGIYPRRVAGNQVVERFAGRGTGDECVRTANGETWNVADYLPEPATGDRQGQLRGNKVYEL